MSVTFYLLHIEDSGGRIDSQRHIFLGGCRGTQREEMRKGCDLPCSDPFILSLNLIGVAQLARCIAPLRLLAMLDSDSKDFYHVVVPSRNLKVFICCPLNSQCLSHLWLNSTK